MSGAICLVVECERSRFMRRPVCRMHYDRARRGIALDVPLMSGRPRRQSKPVHQGWAHDLPALADADAPYVPPDPDMLDAMSDMAVIKAALPPPPPEPPPPVQSPAARIPLGYDLPSPRRPGVRPFSMLRGRV